MISANIRNKKPSCCW